MKLTNLYNNSQSRVITFLIIMIFIYSTLYGTIAIYVDSLFIRSLKDLLFIFLIIISLFKLVFSNENYRFVYLLLGLFISFCIFGSLDFIFIKKDLYTWVYGVKITYIPIAMFFVGYMLSKGINRYLNYTFITLYFVIISVWVIQYVIGIDRLVTFGFEYGVNVKHFIGGLPRLPSLIGTPDGYAVLLAFLGFIIEKDKSIIKKYKLRKLIGVITFIFLLLATIRTAILLWIISQLIYQLFTFRIKSEKLQTLSIALSFIFFPFISLILLIMSAKNTILLSTSSLKERINIWFEGSSGQNNLNLETFIGKGIGEVGAASKRLNSIGSNGSSYAVDNQYLAFYEQMGLLGIFVFLLFISIIFIIFVRRHNNNTIFQLGSLNLISISLLVGVLTSCLFTNTLEIFPFNIFFWFYLGMNVNEFSINNKLKRI
ncbi:hypothetical protein [Metabacillus sp. FJAT-53654]|uniref:Uncharacterized protein n=1 Tax=Metabacillus rhizosphaerae TaxID=3117747 RepID=A0ABZ2MW49_9BACI